MAKLAIQQLTKRIIKFSEPIIQPSTNKSYQRGKNPNVNFFIMILQKANFLISHFFKLWWSANM